MGMKAYTFVGAKRVAYLPDWIKVSVRIVDHARVRSWSPFTHQVKSTYHDTGNPRTKAAEVHDIQTANAPDVAKADPPPAT